VVVVLFLSAELDSKTYTTSDDFRIRLQDILLVVILELGSKTYTSSDDSRIRFQDLYF